MLQFAIEVKGFDSMDSTPATLNDLRARRERILEIARQYRAGNLRVFGSVARGEATPQSDVDLLVDFEPGYALRDHIRLTQALSALLCRKVEIVAEDDLREELRPSILRDVVTL